MSHFGSRAQRLGAVVVKHRALASSERMAPKDVWRPLMVRRGGERCPRASPPPGRPRLRDALLADRTVSGGKIRYAILVLYRYASQTYRAPLAAYHRCSTDSGRGGLKLAFCCQPLQCRQPLRRRVRVVGPAALRPPSLPFTPTRDGGNAARLPSPGEPPE